MTMSFGRWRRHANHSGVVCSETIVLAIGMTWADPSYYLSINTPTNIAAPWYTIPNLTPGVAIVRHPSIRNFRNLFLFRSPSWACWFSHELYHMPILTWTSYGSWLYAVQPSPSRARPVLFKASPDLTALFTQGPIPSMGHWLAKVSASRERNVWSGTIVAE